MFNAGKILCICAFLFSCTDHVFSQTCSTLGQTVYSAFPVCGTTVFGQTTVPTCVKGNVPAPACSSGYPDKNPFWYKFTCFASGPIGFLITPKNNSDDYDWELFDITGHDPAEVYTNSSLIVAYNWSGVTGITGATSQGVHLFECASVTVPATTPSPFSKMPNLIKGHNYLLLISHFDDASQSGYDLSFQDGSGGASNLAIITDPSLPGVQSAYAVCDGSQIVIALTKKMKCSSISADGSDFTVSGPTSISVASATGNGCSTGFDMDSVVLKLNGILSPGTYTVSAKNGADGNTLIDNCGSALATGIQGSLKFTPSQPTPMDSIRSVICVTDTLQLVFSKPINCSSIAPDGSDFLVTGPIAVTVAGASGICNNGVSSIIRVFLSAPIKVNGRFQIAIKNGSDGNTLIDECGQQTPAGSIPFITKNITTADFTSSITSGCLKDTLYLTHDGNNGANQWQWVTDTTLLSTAQKTSYVSNAFGAHITRLTVSNGICSDTAQLNFVFLNQTVKAAFAATDSLCVTDTLHFTDMSTNPVTWKWDFGNGNTSTLQMPPAQTYSANGRVSNYVAGLIVTNGSGCADTTYKLIYVLPNCYIAVPSAFTPNGDGLNDYLYPLNAYKAGNLVFRVYNRYGQVIFETRNWTRKWDGRVNGQLQPSGTYVWTLDYTDTDKQQKVSLKGTTVLIR